MTEQVKADPELAADWIKNLIVSAEKLNEAVVQFQAVTGISATLYVNGYEYGDRVGVRIEGSLIDAHAKPGAAS